MGILAPDKDWCGREAIQAKGAECRDLPLCWPGPDPIDNAVAGCQALSRKAAERSIDGLWTAIGSSPTASRRPLPRTTSTMPRVAGQSGGGLKHVGYWSSCPVAWASVRLLPEAGAVPELLLAAGVGV